MAMVHQRTPVRELFHAKVALDRTLPVRDQVPLESRLVLEHLPADGTGRLLQNSTVLPRVLLQGLCISALFPTHATGECVQLLLVLGLDMRLQSILVFTLFPAQQTLDTGMTGMDFSVGEQVQGFSKGLSAFLALHLVLLVTRQLSKVSLYVLPKEIDAMEGHATVVAVEDPKLFLASASHLKVLVLVVIVHVFTLWRRFIGPVIILIIKVLFRVLMLLLVVVVGGGGGLVVTLLVILILDDVGVRVLVLAQESCVEEHLTALLALQVGVHDNVGSGAESI